AVDSYVDDVGPLDLVDAKAAAKYPGVFVGPRIFFRGELVVTGRISYGLLAYDRQRIRLLCRLLASAKKRPESGHQSAVLVRKKVRVALKPERDDRVLYQSLVPKQLQLGVVVLYIVAEVDVDRLFLRLRR